MLAALFELASTFVNIRQPSVNVSQRRIELGTFVPRLDRGLKFAELSQHVRVSAEVFGPPRIDFNQSLVVVPGLWKVSR